MAKGYLKQAMHLNYGGNVGFQSQQPLPGPKYGDHYLPDPSRRFLPPTPSAPQPVQPMTGGAGASSGVPASNAPPPPQEGEQQDAEVGAGYASPEEAAAYGLAGIEHGYYGTVDDAAKAGKTDVLSSFLSNPMTTGKTRTPGLLGFALDNLGLTDSHDFSNVDQAQASVNAGHAADIGIGIDAFGGKGPDVQNTGIGLSSYNHNLGPTNQQGGPTTDESIGVAEVSDSIGNAAAAQASGIGVGAFGGLGDSNVGPSTTSNPGNAGVTTSSGNAVTDSKGNAVSSVDTSAEAVSEAEEDDAAGNAAAAAASGIGVDAFGGLGPDTGPGEGEGDSKIICTAMIQESGVGRFRQTMWLKHSKIHYADKPEYQKGYHAIFRPLLKVKLVKPILYHLARIRTADLRAQMYGGKRSFAGKLLTLLEPVCYIVGKLKGAK